MFPTEERVRQKERQKDRKAADIDVKRSKIPVEEHYDDCGQDLSGLGSEVTRDASDYLITTTPADYSPFHTQLPRPHDESFCVYDLMNYYDEASALAQYFFKGCEATDVDWLPRRANLRSSTCLQEFIYFLRQADSSSFARDDLVELCRGAARVSVICARLKLKTGEDFDLITCYDLNSNQDQQGVWHYFHTRQPIVALMAPACEPFGPRSHYNKIIFPQTWEASYAQAAPHGRFCGEIGLFQCQRRRAYNDGSCFGNEQPHPSDLYKEHPWPVVLQYPEVSLQPFDQCMTGQVGPSGLPAKKHSGLVSNEPELRKAVAKFKCDGTHQHEEATGSALIKLRLWTWTLAIALATAVVKVTRRVRATESAEGLDAGVLASSTHADGRFYLCKGCASHRDMYDLLHSRDPAECKFPNVESARSDCLGCQRRQGPWGADRNFTP